MQEQRYGEACPKLAESQRLDPSTGTLLNLAVCHEKEGKLASAWSEFNDALARSKHDGRTDRQAFAEEHIEAIEPTLSRLAIVVPKSTAVNGLVVKLDGTAIGDVAWGVALPVNPGPHRIDVSAPSKKTWSATIEVSKGPSSQSVSVPALADGPTESEPAAPNKSDGSTQRIVAYSVAGVGLIAVGAGTFFGLDALNKFNQSNENGCVGDTCDADGAALRNAARQSGDLSTVAFIVGGAALGAGVVLYLTAPSAAPPPDEVSWRAAVRPTLGGGAIELGANW